MSLSHKNIAIWVLILSVGVIFSVAYWLHSQYFPTTDDAYVQAHSIQIAAQINGPVAKVYADNHQKVEKNQLLFTIDPTPYQLNVEKAEALLAVTQQDITAAEAEVSIVEANIKQRRAQLLNAEKYTKRVMTLVNSKILSKAEGDDAIARLASAKAALDATLHQLEATKDKVGLTGDKNMRLLAAEKNLEQARLNLSYTKVYAPAEGILNDFNIRKGTYIIAGKPLFMLIDNTHWWVDADYKETQLSHIRPHQKAIIKVDLYPNHTFHGWVEAISGGSTAANSLLPPEDSTGNWVKVTQRFAVRVAIMDPDPKFPLRVGASSTVTIDTKHI